MPVRKQSVASRRHGDIRFSDLKRRLIAEWREEAAQAGAAPEIVEETNAAQKLVHVYVIWDDWADIDAQTRSEMIVDALQEVRGTAAVLDLSIAMGLTPAEAKRIGIAS